MTGKPCKFFAQGSCRVGASCKFSHDRAVESSNHHRDNAAPNDQKERTATDSSLDKFQTHIKLDAIQSVQRNQEIMESGQDLPTASGYVAAMSNQLATLYLQQDLPGNLSRAGRRHDNDFADIHNIQILPTVDEIYSSRPEYLPTRDPTTHHLKGEQGLLDRHFRLLREDTVGQLRNAVRQFSFESENYHQNTRPHHQDTIRTNIFRNATMTMSFFHRNKGLLHVIEFDQPRKFSSPSGPQRHKLWTESGFLPLGACLCLVGSDKHVAFYTVVDRDPMSIDDKPEFSSRINRNIVRGYLTSLHDDPKRAAIIVQLCDAGSTMVSEVFAQQTRHAQKTMSGALLEFPGVLLASFTHTLQALKQMCQDQNLPFSELIAPNSSIARKNCDVEPPSYARRPGFRFDLSQITKGQDIHFSPQESFDGLKFRETSGLDESQARAFVFALRNKFALIQGPPGTGKSYVGVQLIRTLLHNRDAGKIGPILCVCYTNHALDQILEHLMGGGVGEIVRVGAGSKSAALAEVNLKKLAMGIELTKTDKQAKRSANSELEEISEDAKDYLNKISNAESVAYVKQHLLMKHPKIWDRFFDQEDEDESFQGMDYDPHKPLLDWRSGGVRCPGVGKSQDEFDEMTHQEREGQYQRWAQEIRSAAITEIQDLCERFRTVRETLDSCNDGTSLRCLQQAHIVGITTTGLAKNINLLKKLGSKVLMIEEAGEIMEAHMLPVLLPSLEHVIAIGDHQQLRPTISNFDLSVENPRGAQYSLDVSLFERLINPQPGLPKLPFITLQTQRRMHPLISRLVRETIYPNLVDDPTVSEYPEIKSMRRRIFWLDHERQEASADLSKSNDYEVEMTASIVTHLLKQGNYKTSQITVVTPYLAQLQKLRRRFSKITEIMIDEKDREGLKAAGLAGEPTPQAGARPSTGKGLRISTVDNFQGEESDIIVVSLVRCNAEGKAGFLRTPNRINVLLSRARHGMYIVGNTRTARTVPMWNQVIEMLKADGAVGTSFPGVYPRR